MRRAAIALLLVAFLLVGAGCGGGDDEAADDTVVTETTETTDETTGLDVFASEECLQLVSIGAALSQAFTGTGGADAEETSELFAELVDKAPDKIRADIETLAAGFAEYAEAIRELDLQEGEVPSAAQLQQIQAALASVDQPELTAASERISAWAQENCS
jgi:ABC-type glycerol-3-phosphate transport system substrate-binding protein